jgi:hypothetical protein
MNDRYEATATAIKQAEEALNTLKEFSENQYKAKGETMLEQILDYITNTLNNASYICCGFTYKHLVLTNIKNKFIFYIYEAGAIGSGYPIFSITNDGKIKNRIELSEWMMLTLIKEWGGFKEEFDVAIKKALTNRTKHINDQLSHIGYVNEQLAKWHV